MLLETVRKKLVTRPAITSGFRPRTGHEVRPANVEESKTPALAGVSEAGDGARTHDPQLGKLMLYQLSYARVVGLS